MRIRTMKVQRMSESKSMRFTLVDKIENNQIEADLDVINPMPLVSHNSCNWANESICKTPNYNRKGIKNENEINSI